MFPLESFPQPFPLRLLQLIGCGPRITSVSFKIIWILNDPWIRSTTQATAKWPLKFDPRHDSVHCDVIDGEKLYSSWCKRSYRSDTCDIMVHHYSPLFHCSFLEVREVTWIINVWCHMGVTESYIMGMGASCFGRCWCQRERPEQVKRSTLELASWSSCLGDVNGRIFWAWKGTSGKLHGSMHRCSCREPLMWSGLPSFLTKNAEQMRLDDSGVGQWGRWVDDGWCTSV